MVILGCMLINGLTGCVYKNKKEYLAKKTRIYDEQSDAIMQSILDALEAQDIEALKELFSPYMLENTEDLEQKMEELMEFYPGSEGGVEGDCISSRGAHYGDIVLMLNGTYTISNKNEIYEVNFVAYPQNDEEPDKEGIYLIEVMTEDAEPQGFKWKNEEDAPGIYILE